VRVRRYVKTTSCNQRLLHSARSGGVATLHEEFRQDKYTPIEYKKENRENKEAE
jgi:hypothetical protein